MKTAPNDEPFENRVCLITGASARIGAAIAGRVHGAGGRVIIHYGNSADAAEQLAGQFNERRPNSAATVGCDLRDLDALGEAAEVAHAAFDRIDFVVNNASTFYATEIGATRASDWDDLFGVNVRAAYFLVQALTVELKRRRGAIINIADVYAARPLAGHAVYCAAKAALIGLNRSFARELAPAVRSNVILPGAILWPDNPDGADRDEILSRTPLERKGDVNDIAATALFLLRDAPFVTGQEIAVDGGRSIVP